MHSTGFDAPFKSLKLPASVVDKIYGPNAEKWFDHVMKKLEEFDLTVTFCYTPEAKGIQPHHTSPPQNNQEFADFCVTMMRRYA
jgi:hypothetical protein